MPTSGSASTLSAPGAVIRPPALPGYVAGQRALLLIAPNISSPERVCAGVVTRLHSGEVDYTCAIDLAKAKHAFGGTGEGLYMAANALCESLSQHWRINPDARRWVPPFESASLGELQIFSDVNATAGRNDLLEQTSSLHTLFANYKHRRSERNNSIVSKVKSAIGRNMASKHLGVRFDRPLRLGAGAGELTVDFLGQNFACYFLQITQSERGIEATAERAYSRLYELQALRGFVQKPKKAMGLLEDERPHAFELLMVGASNDPVQKRVIKRVTALADKGQIRTRPLDSAEAAADHVHTMERKQAKA